MPERVCPKCSFVNPASAALCDCGYVFDQAGAEAARAAGFRPHGETHPPGPSLGARIGWSLLGFLAGALPCLLVQEIWQSLASRDDLGTAARGLFVLTGLGGLAVALLILQRRHAHKAKKARGAQYP